MIVLPEYRNAPLASTLRWARGQHFYFKYHEAPAMPVWTANHSYMAAPHVLNPKIRHLYENRDPNTLWWRVVTQHLPTKKIVRSTCAKRARAAFREVLYLKGYDENGRPLPLGKLPEGLSPRPRALAGTLDIMVNQSAVTLEGSQIIRDLMRRQLGRLIGLMENRSMLQPENSK